MAQRPRLEEPRSWPLNLESYSPALTFGRDVAAKLSDFEKHQLSTETAVRCIAYTRNHSVLDFALTNENTQILETDSDNMHEILFINRLERKPDAIVPYGSTRFAISKEVFGRILMRHEIPPTFISSMINKGLSSSFASLPFQYRQLSVTTFDFMYILPVRIAAPVTRTTDSRTLLVPSLDSPTPWINIFSQLLGDGAHDIRRSRIAVFCQHDISNHQTRIVCLDFQDGQSTDLVEEPRIRTKEVFEHARRTNSSSSPFFFHMILLTSIAEWWRRTLVMFDKHLVACEMNFQHQVAQSPTITSPENFVDKTNKTLHIIVAHIHRYKREMDMLEEVALGLSKHCQCSCTPQLHMQKRNLRPDGEPQTQASHTHSSLESNFANMAAEFKSLHKYVLELEEKAERLINLLFDNMQVISNRAALANGVSMRQILAATRTEAELSRNIAKRSQQMAIEMRKDSISMKTIAVMTMFFLPATTFAAILSMPFFEQTWMAKVDRAWLWVALSFPSTLIAFAVFFMYTRRGDREVEEATEIEMDAIDRA